MSAIYSSNLEKVLEKKKANTGFDTIPENVLGIKDVPKWIRRYIPMTNKPHPYQYEVVKWMTEMRKGGILNLDPGMGKTYTSLLHMNLTYSMLNLVVCNRSQLIVWKEEIEKFYGDKFRVLYAHKEYVDTSLHGFTRKKLEKYDIVVTTYESISMCYRMVCDFQKVFWNNVYCDEVHRIRNPRTQMYTWIKKIECQRFWGLTGSLIFNKIDDARAIQSIIDEESIYSLSNIKTLRLEDVGIELPKLYKHYTYTDFTPIQKKMYDQFALQAENILETLGTKGFKNKSYGHIFAILTWLREITISPSLIEESHNLKKFDPENDYKSPRIEKISEEIEKREEQGVVFCFFRKSLNLIKKNLRERGIRCKVIKSEHSSKEKQHYIDMFRKGKFRVILTTYKTGGLGFNLTNANHVYLCSLWWNMQVIQQAFRRCFRPGQVRETNVHFFMKKESVEDRMLDICKSKAELTENFLLENYKKIKISKDVLKMLF